eukprot:TRINITY_DN4458_c0_g1_i1.p1 TRINITY_DN4458_c0_g1~~TRINITY_DN4458_c0_g1_i1.p1  ORF type:complete len:746 (-),score=134.59 TRINITY_DN4458_c0_g1_i1:60-2297(-)
MRSATLMLIRAACLITAAVAINATDGGASAVTGVKGNEAGDLSAFLSALLLNGLTVAGVLAGFTVLRVNFPMVYCYNELKEKMEHDEAGSEASSLQESWRSKLIAWVRKSVTTSTDQASRSAGLDAALLSEFCWLCTKILATVGIPIAIMMCPLHAIFGGDEAGEDRLGRIEMANISSNHPWLYYVHAGIVWLVCFAVHRFLFSAQARFLKRRIEWLQSLPAPRSTTVLVEHIPEAWRSSEKLLEFFGRVFKPDDVLNAHVVKHADRLSCLVDKRRVLEEKKKDSDLTFARDGERPTTRLGFFGLFGERVDSIEYYEAQLSDVNLELAEAKADLERRSREQPSEVSSHCAFVTFQGRRHAEIAQSLQYSTNKNQWRVCAAPVASDVRWSDLRRHENVRTVHTVLGIACVVGLFIGFIPIVLAVTTLATTITLGPLQPVWAGLAPTIGLMLFLGLLPTVLLAIFRNFFVLRADAWAQHALQLWYFIFQLIFVVLVTAVGQSLVTQVQRLAQDPTSIFQTLAGSLPSATHFYMNYIVLQWAAHAMELLRMANLAKFLFWRLLYTSEEAKQKAEPESQDSSGMGARSVKLSINMVLSILFCSCSPLIPVLGMLDFALSRLVYGYLLVYTETKKPDLGGAFWVRQLYQVQLGLFLYCVLMFGTLAFKAPEQYAQMIVAPTLLFVAWSHFQLRRAFQWQKLPFEEVAFGCEDILQKQQGRRTEEEGFEGTDYVQPELLAPVSCTDAADRI